MFRHLNVPYNVQFLLYLCARRVYYQLTRQARANLIQLYFGRKVADTSAAACTALQAEDTLMKKNARFPATSSRSAVRIPMSIRPATRT